MSEKIMNRSLPKIDIDPTAAERKADHILLAFQSQVAQGQLDNRFYYEPLLAAHPERGSFPEMQFLGKTSRVPMWVSSMTGGTEMANRINHNLARACGEFGFGMGLGSCRALLYSDERLSDFAVRHIIGQEVPLYANLGVAQLEELIDAGDLFLLNELIDKLEADGLIIHVNPFQEWLQPEGDRFKRPPLETILTILEKFSFPIIVKEVGQGFGYESLKTLFQLPLAAVDFAANGGTNFAKLELLRSDKTRQEIYGQLANVGHSAAEMVNMTNEILADMGDKAQCKQVIISGGVKTFLDGYYLTEKLNTTCVYGQASSFLQHARGEYQELKDFVDSQVQGLELAKAFLRVK